MILCVHNIPNVWIIITDILFCVFWNWPVENPYTSLTRIYIVYIPCRVWPQPLGAEYSLIDCESLGLNPERHRGVPPVALSLEIATGVLHQGSVVPEHCSTAGYSGWNALKQNTSTHTHTHLSVSNSVVFPCHRTAELANYLFNSQNRRNII